ncbi:hypothetical protein DUNSADRAFT_508 [Dunaliella salina]|uniref:Uncharacterized protein n=1 Tax=Dunaliella salina TaxID=3046 RepID=A0ABQ7GY52_DUNSA|nr:hypothetical protein DUNSADRAFT_508 [Dunaliella salina]|eukprot:KAF5839535.1 hypothetical protein DUNSADRAFT_508 [Dunaliella salina]
MMQQLSYKAPLVQGSGFRSLIGRRFPLRHTCKLYAASGNAPPSKEVYQGTFGPWSIEEEDVKEVLGYRAGITVAAAATIASAGTACFAPEGSQLQGLLDPMCVLGAGGLGVSLYLIHIYVAPLKKALQAFWLAGTLGMLYIMATQDAPAALYLAQTPSAVWLVGPLFASLTGMAFKEGLCYGKGEAALLFGTVPLLSLGHLTQLMPREGEQGLLATVLAIFAVFAARKYTQEIKDDIGDKSVFAFMALPPEEQEAALQKLKGNGSSAEL